jgi:hypothetical protein
MKHQTDFFIKFLKWVNLIFIILPGFVFLFLGLLLGMPFFEYRIPGDLLVMYLSVFVPSYICMSGGIFLIDYLAQKPKFFRLFFPGFFALAFFSLWSTFFSVNSYYLFL